MTMSIFHQQIIDPLLYTTLSLPISFYCKNAKATCLLTSVKMFNVIIIIINSTNCPSFITATKSTCWSRHWI